MNIAQDYIYKKLNLDMIKENHNDQIKCKLLILNPIQTYHVRN